MKNLIQAATAFALFAASTVQAQQAVQWKVSEGGNGHWYRLELSPMGWSVARSAALAKGGDLASLGTDAEFNWVRVTIPGHPWPSEGCHLGGIQASSSPTPDAGWSWLTGGPVAINVNLDVDDNPCGQGCCGENNEQNFLHAYENWQKLGDENEGAFSPTCPGSATAYASIIEWSADCNNDGIVDYGQCRDGSLPDHNGNNVPDCCEAGSPCVVGNYPVQWLAADGGNGHWYANVAAAPLPTTVSAMQYFAASRGASLASITSAEENQVILSLLQSIGAGESFSAWIGLYRAVPGDPWRWTDGSQTTWTGWGGASCGAGPYPNDTYFAGEVGTVIYRQNCGLIWDDSPTAWIQNPPPWWGGVAGMTLLLEWSADCNNDGIVDKGQILLGQLPDVNGNGIPDGCEVPSCIDADIYRDFNVNGADLGILLAQWGPNTPLTESDLNHDGSVDGVDLGILLSFWGPCP